MKYCERIRFLGKFVNEDACIIISIRASMFLSQLFMYICTANEESDRVLVQVCFTCDNFKFVTCIIFFIYDCVISNPEYLNLQPDINKVS